MEHTDIITRVPKTENNYTTSSTAPLFLIAGGPLNLYGFFTNINLVSKNFLVIKDPAICSGKPIIRGTRISIAQIIELNYYLGWSEDKILSSYPHLTKDQIKAAQEYYSAHSEEIDLYIKQENEID